MVTALSALYLGPTHRTENDSILTRAPAFELGLHGIFTTRAVAVPIFTTAEADLVATLRAGHLPFVHVSANHMAVTVWLRAKAHKRISFERLLILEVV